MMGGRGGGGGGGGGGDNAEAEYATAKTSVWWDIENCQVPRDCDPHAIAKNISSALVKMNYRGPVSISAYGDTNGIKDSVQQALSSTGIALNHVPAGVKDASDKKILVDMLFWAVDNPAPANYLLISGDRDFSNALHQLRLRRYNILLAQPQKASAPLIAAAKSVWLWTSLLAGGPPLSEGESQQLGANSHYSTSDTVQVPVSDSMHAKQDSYSENSHFGNQKPSYAAKSYDPKPKGKSTHRNSNQTKGGKASPTPVRNQCDQHNFIPHNPGPCVPNVPPSGPSPDFVPGNTNFTRSDVTHVPGNPPIHHPQQLRPNLLSVQREFPRGNHYPPILQSSAAPPVPARRNGTTAASSPLTNVPDIGNLNISGHSSLSSSRTPSIAQQQTGKGKHGSKKNAPKSVGLSNSQISSLQTPSIAKGQTGEGNHDSKKNAPKSVGSSNSQDGYKGQNMPSGYHEMQKSRYFGCPEYPPSSSSETSVSSGQWDAPVCPVSSEYIQGVIADVLLALNTLKTEQIMPTEANIADCMRYGDSKRFYLDAKMALESAIEHQMVVKQNVGPLQLYVGKNEKLWTYVNPVGGNAKKYSKAIWDAVKKFLQSPAGRSAILASQCRYEAGTILKTMCLKDLSLGNILQILSLVIAYKKWIIHHQSGWQPLEISLAEVNADAGSGGST